MSDLSITLADLAGSSDPSHRAELARWATLLSPDNNAEPVSLAHEIAALPPVGVIEYVERTYTEKIGRLTVTRTQRLIISSRHNPSHATTKEYR